MPFRKTDFESFIPNFSFENPSREQKLHQTADLPSKSACTSGSTEQQEGQRQVLHLSKNTEAFQSHDSGLKLISFFIT